MFTKIVQNSYFSSPTGPFMNSETPIQFYDILLQDYLPSIEPLIREGYILFDDADEDNNFEESDFFEVLSSYDALNAANRQ